MEEILKKIVETGTQFGLKLIFAAAILIIGIKLSKWAVKIILKSRTLSGMDEGVRKFIGKSVKITLYVLIIISAAGILGIPYASFVAILGSAGVAIGLALQGSLSNIAAGILILVNKPFKVGDYIAAGDIEGTVSEIGFFATKIITADNKQVSYPNAALSNTSVTDYTALGTRRIDLVFSTSYDSDIDTVKNILINVASADSLVFSEPKPEAHLSNHADSALEFKLMIWCKSSDYWTVRYNMLENVKKAFDKEKIEIPYPKLDVSVQQIKGEK